MNLNKLKLNRKITCYFRWPIFFFLKLVLFYKQTIILFMFAYLINLNVQLYESDTPLPPSQV